MDEANKKSTGTYPQKIILKKGCLCQMNTGVLKLPHEIQANAEPILFSNNDLRGYNFKNHLYEGVTYDLERITAVHNDGKTIHSIHKH